MKHQVTFYVGNMPHAVIIDDADRARRLADSMGERLRAEVWEITEDGAALIWRAGGGLEADQGAGPKIS